MPISFYLQAPIIDVKSWPVSSGRICQKEKRVHMLRHELWRIRKAISALTELQYLSSDDISIYFDADAGYWLDVDQLVRLGDSVSARGSYAGAPGI